MLKLKKAVAFVLTCLFILSICTLSLAASEIETRAYTNRPTVTLSLPRVDSGGLPFYGGTFYSGFMFAPHSTRGFRSEFSCGPQFGNIRVFMRRDGSSSDIQSSPMFSGAVSPTTLLWNTYDSDLNESQYFRYHKYSPESGDVASNYSHYIEHR